MTERNWSEYYSSLSEEQLDALALIRVIECSNGCMQQLYRNDDPRQFPIEQTRAAMKYSMAAMKNLEFVVGDETIKAEGEFADVLREVRDLYVNGFKKDDAEARAEFFRSSVATVKALGNERIVKAAVRVAKELSDVLPTKAVALGVDYLQRLAPAI